MIPTFLKKFPLSKMILMYHMAWLRVLKRQLNAFRCRIFNFFKWDSRNLPTKFSKIETKLATKPYKTEYSFSKASKRSKRLHVMPERGLIHDRVCWRDRSLRAIFPYTVVTLLKSYITTVNGNPQEKSRLKWFSARLLRLVLSSVNRTTSFWLFLF